jgi:thiol-disulfide isomerase/thioredoxin
MKLVLVLTAFFLISGVNSFAQGFRKISKNELIKILKDPSDKLHVINFWATWCAPCVKELPEFQKVVIELDVRKVDFLFVSLDFPSEADKKLPSFLKKNNYTFNVALMTETDYNLWIDQVDSNWQGGIPATLFYNRARNIHHFVSEPMDEPQLIKTIQSLL